MTSFFRRPLTIALVTMAAISANPSQAQLDPAAYTQLRTLRQTPDSAGALIYRGDTFAQRTTAVKPLYRYERRVTIIDNGFSATHTTSDAAGNLAVVESAQFSNDYALRRFDVVNQQGGYSGSVVVSGGGRHLEYRLIDHGNVSTATEEVSEPVISGPSMFGFILKNWDVLKAGTPISLRIIVLKEKTSYGFHLRFEKQTGGQAEFSITPSSFLIRLAVAPLRVVFDASTRNPVRYEGRVPPMEVVSGNLKDLDARVEYTSVSAVYR